jgi:excisionase family DNA binding protein
MKHLRTKHLIEYFGLSRMTIHRWLKSGKIRAVKVGRDYRIEPESVKHLFFNESEFQGFYAKIK